MAEAHFVDSSALVQRYVIETGTAWVRRLTHPSTGRRIDLARITAVEVTAAVARRGAGACPPARAAGETYLRPGSSKLARSS